MLSKTFHLLLLLTIAIGIAMTIQAQLRLRPLKAEYSRLVAEYADLQVADPAKFKIARLSELAPRHYRWRLYRPGNLRLHTETLRGFGGNQGAGSRTDNFSIASDELVRLNVKFLESEIQFFLMHGGESSWTIANPELASVVQAHWDELTIRLAASDGPQVFGTDEILTLIEIVAPEKFADGTRLQTMDGGICFQYRVGAMEAFELEKSKGKP